MHSNKGVMHRATQTVTQKRAPQGLPITCTSPYPWLLVAASIWLLLRRPEK